MTASDSDDLLKILQAHGQQFLNSFSLPLQNQFASVDRSEVSDNEYEEWTGVEIDEAMSSGSEDELDDGDDNLITDRVKQPDIMVFSDQIASSSRAIKTAGKAFMSSKVSKLRQELEIKQRKPLSKEDEEFTNIQNDALLHRLVHTKLLSGSLNPNLELTPAQRRKALAGRVLELAGENKLGKGESAVRLSERNKAAKHVRDGLAKKEQAREHAHLEEARQLGNYHPALKKLYKSSSSSANSRPRKRDKGLGMGVGKFSGGVLKLTRDDVKSVQAGRGSREKHSRRGRSGRR